MKSVGIKKVKFKPLNWNDILEMQRLAIVNCRGLRATINHMSAMVNGLTAASDKVLRSRYQAKVDVAKIKLKDEELWLTYYTKLLSNRQNA